MTMTTEQITAMQNEIEALKAEIARKTAQTTTNRLSLRVSEKGALSVYGLGRFPITLYREQWERLLAIADEIKTFAVANDAKLVKKADKVS